MFIAKLFIIARTWKQPRCPLEDEWTRELWYIYTMEYYSAIEKNRFELVLMRWMKLEPIIQSEGSQKGKHQYSILTIYMDFRKMGTIALYGRQKKTHRCIEVFWILWERARVGWLGRMALKHVYYHMWHQSPVQVWCMIQGARGWCNGMTQKDGMGREMGRGFRMGNMCTHMVNSCQCIAKPKNIIK